MKEYPSYWHYKGGEYKVIANRAKHTETGEEVVVYMNTLGSVFVRQYDMFHGHIEDGRKRFTCLDVPNICHDVANGRTAIVPTE